MTVGIASLAIALEMLLDCHSCYPTFVHRMIFAP